MKNFLFKINFLSFFMLTFILSSSDPKKEAKQALTGAIPQKEIHKIISDYAKEWVFYKELKDPKADTLNIDSLFFSPDSKSLVSTTINKIKIWNINSGNIINSISKFPEKSFFSGGLFSPNNKFLAFTAFSDGTINLWDLTTNTIVKSQRVKDDPRSSIAFSSDSKFLAYPSSNNIDIWDITTDKVKSLKVDAKSVESVSFPDNDNNIIASGNSDGTINIWDINSGKIIKNFISDRGGIIPSGHQYPEVLFSPKNNKILAYYTADMPIKLWDAFSEKNTIISLNAKTPFAFTSDGKFIAAASTDFFDPIAVNIFDISSGHLVQQLKPRLDGFSFQYSIGSIAFSPNGKYLVISVNPKQSLSVNSEGGKIFLYESILD